MKDQIEQLIASQVELTKAIREQSRMLDQLSGAIIDLVQEHAQELDDDVPRLLDGSPA